MNKDLSKNTLIGATLVDTLVNINSVLMLLKTLNCNNDISESTRNGLFLIYTSIQDSLEFEIKKGVT